MELSLPSTTASYAAISANVLLHPVLEVARKLITHSFSAVALIHLRCASLVPLAPIRQPDEDLGGPAIVKLFAILILFEVMDPGFGYI